MSSRYYRISLAAALLLAASLLAARQSAAQSPFFPNTQAVNYNSYYGLGSYENTVAGWGANARLGLRPLPAVYSQPLPSPGQGYNFVRGINAFPNGGGYGSAWPNSNYSPYGYWPNGYGR
jgi:hypothetical protein